MSTAGSTRKYFFLCGHSVFIKFPKSKGFIFFSSIFFNFSIFERSDNFLNFSNYLIKLAIVAIIVAIDAVEVPMLSHSVRPSARRFDFVGTTI